VTAPDHGALDDVGADVVFQVAAELRPVLGSALASSASYAAAMTRSSMVGFIVRVSACQISTGSPFFP